jgi:hypothetical protein
MFLKQKQRLYFDENFPIEAIEHFRSAYWKKRVWITGALISNVASGSRIRFITRIAKGIDIHWSLSTPILTTTGDIHSRTATCPA